MEKLELEDFDTPLPESMRLAVLMEKRPSAHPWAEFSFDAIGVVVGEQGDRAPTRVYQDGEVRTEKGKGRYVDRPTFAPYYDAVNRSAEVHAPTAVDRMSG